MTAAVALGPGSVVGFVGLGRMGTPMARRLAAAGYLVRCFDTDSAARDQVRDFGGTPVDEVVAVAAGADAVLLMLPNSDVVEQVLHAGGLLAALPAGCVLVDMGSSRPLSTRALAEAAAARSVRLVDAPVSGGLAGAVAGTLTVMAGGAPADVDRVRPIFEEVGRQALHVGQVGAGHALKALNNLMSATHLLISSEALLAGKEFGIDPKVMLDAVNGSSGRSGSTEVKWPQFVLTESFASGFGLRLMLKDMRIAVELAEATGWPPQLGHAALELWASAARELPAEADHTEIVRWLEQVHASGNQEA